MEFRLLYEGELLPCTNTKRRTAEKHAIRRAFHPQLRRLWSVKQNLRFLAGQAFVNSLGDKPIDSQARQKSEEERFDLGIGAMGALWTRAGYNLVPLVTALFGVRCALDILILRPEEDRFIFTQGDIDGQVKTLFDALRIPDSPDETAGATPTGDEDPLFCLLQDDNLITEVKVTADQLLMLPRQKELRANDCFVLIDVKVNHKLPGTWGKYF